MVAERLRTLASAGLDAEAEELAKAAGMPNRVAFGFALSDGAHTVW